MTKSYFFCYHKYTIDNGRHRQTLHSVMVAGYGGASFTDTQMAKISLVKKPKNNIIENLVIAAKFNDFHTNINDKNFPTVSAPSINGAQLRHYGKYMSSEAIHADLKARGRRAATAAEILLWATTHLKEQRRYWIVALGQVCWAGSGSADRVVVLGGGTNFRNAFLRFYEYGWSASNRFLSLPL